MQQWYDEEFGPTGTSNGGAYADKSYWICTENWGDLYNNPSQNYPIDLDVYYDTGGFGNGYVPLFFVVGDGNEVYYDDNPNDFRAALRLAIDEMPVPTVPPSSPTLAGPADASFVSEVRPTFTWGETAQTSSYTIQIDDNSDFSSPEFEQTQSVAYFIPGTDLVENTTYYWKVLSTNVAGSSSYSAGWSVTFAIPNISLSTSTLTPTAAPDATVQESFNISNTAAGSLDYDLSVDYFDYIYPETENFDIALGWTADLTAKIEWTRSTSSSNLDGTPFATIRARGTGNASDLASGLLTSDVFDASMCHKLYIEFDQYSQYDQSTGIVEYSIDGGTNWTEIYHNGAVLGDFGAPDHQLIIIPEISATMTIRFTAILQNRSAGYWHIDNVSIKGPQYDWLSFDSPLSGSVLAAGSNAINLTCDATGMPEATYSAEVYVDSNDPDEPNKVLPVSFIVSAGGGPIVPAVPAPVTTSIVGTDLVIEWDDSADATGYDIYALDDPYGTFVLVDQIVPSTYTVAADQAKLFYKIVATNATKKSAKTTIVKPVKK